MAAARRLPPSALLAVVALLACTTARVAVAGSICETAECGKGNCTEVPGLIPGTTGYRCDCDPGWSRMLNFVPASPCTIPNCSYDSSCFDLPFAPPRGIPLTDPCVLINCGSGGTCQKGDGFSYHCECQPGYVNVLNLTALPCIKNCYFGADCSRLGLEPPPGPPPVSPPSGSPTPSGSASRHGLLQLLMLVSLVIVQVM